MKPLLNFFTSLKTTIVLVVLIVLASAVGSFQIPMNPNIYGNLSAGILIPWFISDGYLHLSSTWWLPALTLFLTLIGINTIVCTIQRLYKIWGRGINGSFKTAISPYLPHLVHIGFLIGLIGHFIGNAYGFKVSGNLLYKGDSINVPHYKGLYITLNASKEIIGNDGRLAGIIDDVNLTNGKDIIKKGTIEINRPLIYKGIAFYHSRHGNSPSGFILKITESPERNSSPLSTETVKVQLGGRVRFAEGKELVLGRLYPDFALDKSGKPYNRSNTFNNPVQELSIYNDKGIKNKTWLPVGRKGDKTSARGIEITLADYLWEPYVVLNINYNPGVLLVFTGSLISVIGVFSLLFIRGEAELVKNRNLIRQKFIPKSLKTNDTSRTL